MRARCASAWPVFGHLVQRSSVSRSTYVTLKGGSCRPLRIVTLLGILLRKGPTFGLLEL